ncbi:MAG: glycosyltransferase family 2 protein [Hormoscilla sp. GUM202]|nr:glycosyltransferase family 2 protein [Hormoscilla sp. GUM202]
MLVSVIIPVYNDAEPLRTCLECLENQTYPKESYEVIVVDNASQSDTASVVNEFSQAMITYEKKPGSYAARNKGISVAKGEIIAFTDADCIPAADWIEKGVEKEVAQYVGGE